MPFHDLRHSLDTTLVTARLVAVAGEQSMQDCLSEKAFVES